MDFFPIEGSLPLSPTHPSAARRSDIAASTSSPEVRLHSLGVAEVRRQQARGMHAVTPWRMVKSPTPHSSDQRASEGIEVDGCVDRSRRPSAGSPQADGRRHASPRCSGPSCDACARRISGDPGKDLCRGRVPDDTAAASSGSKARLQYARPWASSRRCRIPAHRPCGWRHGRRRCNPRGQAWHTAGKYRGSPQGRDSPPQLVDAAAVAHRLQLGRIACEVAFDARVIRAHAIERHQRHGQVTGHAVAIDGAEAVRRLDHSDGRRRTLLSLFRSLPRAFRGSAAPHHRQPASYWLQRWRAPLRSISARASRARGAPRGVPCPLRMASPRFAPLLCCMRKSAGIAVLVLRRYRSPSIPAGAARFTGSRRVR